MEWKSLWTLSMCNDLVAEEAVYHTFCMNRFRLIIHSGNKRGRPEDSSMKENFNSICRWLEETADCDLYTLLQRYNKITVKTFCQVCLHG